MSFVYILQSKCDGHFYTGTTRDIDRRLKEHNEGKVGATSNRRPLRLVAYFKLADCKKAARFELYLKSGSGRAFLNKHIL